MNKTQQLKNELQKSGVFEQIANKQVSENIALAIIKQACIKIFGTVLKNVICEVAVEAMRVSYPQAENLYHYLYDVNLEELFEDFDMDIFED